jgi:hypothetical protein
LDRLRPDLSIKLYLPEYGEGWARRLGLAFSCVPETIRCRRDRLVEWVGQHLEEDRPEFLVVDCFPNGLLGELESFLPTIEKKIFLTRWLHPRFVTRESNRTALDSFSVKLCTERLAPAFASFDFEEVGPILPCSPNEVLTREEARRALGLPKTAQIVWHQTTKTKTRPYQTALEALSVQHNFQLFHISPDSDLSKRAFPAARYLRAANLFVGPPGHQTYYEVVQAGVPAVFFPVDIPNDDQFKRSQGAYGPIHSQIYTPKETELASLFPQILESKLQPIHQFHGRKRAAERILSFLSQKS